MCTYKWLKDDRNNKKWNVIPNQTYLQASIGYHKTTLQNCAYMGYSVHLQLIRIVIDLMLPASLKFKNWNKNFIFIETKSQKSKVKSRF